MFTRKTIIEVALQTGGVCFYCGNPAYSIDHFIPTSKGGENTKNNMVPCCKKCNKVKNSRTLEHFRELMGMRANDMPRFSDSHISFLSKHNIKLPKFHYEFWFEKNKVILDEFFNK